MKRLMAFMLALVLVLGLLPVAPVHGEGFEFEGSLIDQFVEQYDCIMLEPGTVRASDLKAGKSYACAGEVNLELDADRKISAFFAGGDVYVSGDHTLTADILYSEGWFGISSGTVKIDWMDNPPGPGFMEINGIRGLSGVGISGGTVTVTVISAGPAVVSISGGKVTCGGIRGINGVYIHGGTVKAGSIWGREEVEVSGGTLETSSLFGYSVVFSGGVSKIGKIDDEEVDLRFTFPMAITKPAGARFENGNFVSHSGKPVSGVTIQKGKPVVKTSNMPKTGNVRLDWYPFPNAKTYEVWRATSPDGNYKLMKTTTNTWYVNTYGTVGKTYYYKVRAVKGRKSTDDSKAVSQIRKLAQPAVTGSHTASGRNRLTWKEIEGAKCYKVFRATSKTGEYRLMKTTKNLSYININAESGKTYYYKVIAVHENPDANSAESVVCSLKMK